MPAGKSIQFKFILKGKGGGIIWQPGSDRVINTLETMNRITVSEDWENAELQEIIEEDQLAQPNEEPQLVSEMSTFAENLDDPKEEPVPNVSEVSSIEASQSQTPAAEKPVVEPDLQQTTSDSVSSLMEKPMAIVAENIGSFEDFSKSKSYKENIRIIQPSEESAIQLSEESADSPQNDDIIYDLGHNGNAAPIMNQERTIVGGNLFDLEPGPVLVPGLTPPVVPTEEEGPGEVQEGEVQERSTMETSSEAFESKDQNIPEVTA